MTESLANQLNVLMDLQKIDTQIFNMRRELEAMPQEKTAAESSPILPI